MHETVSTGTYLAAEISHRKNSNTKFTFLNTILKSSKTHKWEKTASSMWPDTFIHFWHAPVWVCSTKCRHLIILLLTYLLTYLHHSPEWTILAHIRTQHLKQNLTWCFPCSWHKSCAWQFAWNKVLCYLWLAIRILPDACDR